MSTATEEERRRTYGGWRPPASPGIGPLKLIPSVLLFGMLVLSLVLTMAAGFLVGLCFAAATVVASLPAVLTRNQRSYYSRWSKRWSWRRHVRRGRHVYRSGLAGVTASGQRSLPGLLTKPKVWRFEDSAGRPFALIQYPSARQWSVVMDVAIQGGTLVPPNTRDVWVASWGEWMASLGTEGGVVQAEAVVETLPEPKARLVAHVESLIDPDAPEFAKSAARASARELPAGVADSVGYVSVTFSEAGMGITGRKNTEDMAANEAVATEIGRRLPGLSVSLADSGTSAGHPQTVDQLARRVKEAYDPGSVDRHSMEEAEGHEVHIGWANCGPAEHVATKNGTEYIHDSGWSRTWEATRLPRGVVFDSSLHRLIAPLPGVARKRVVIIYRPTDAGETATQADRDYKAAINRAGRRKGLVHAHDSVDVKSAQKATVEEATGAGMGTWSMLVTATVDAEADRDEFDKASNAIERAARGLKFRLERVYGAQDAAFTAGLGIGISLPDLSVIPNAVRDHV